MARIVLQFLLPLNYMNLGEYWKTDRMQPLQNQGTVLIVSLNNKCNSMHLTVWEDFVRSVSLVSFVAFQDPKSSKLLFSFLTI
jgi:hypothetical protein